MTKAGLILSGGNEDQLIEIFKDIKQSDWIFSNWRSHYYPGRERDRMFKYPHGHRSYSCAFTSTPMNPSTMRGLDLTPIMQQRFRMQAAERIAQLESRASELGCYSAFSDKPAPSNDPPKSGFDECFSQCKQHTQRTDEQCFDSCKR